MIERIKIGRNEKCPCGSGKKFKNCCIDKPVKKAAILGETQDANPFFGSYNTIDLLLSFAGLSLLPENHGKNIRFEELAECAIHQLNRNEAVSAKILKEFLDAEYPMHHMEDPPNNLFTDLITFFGGDYVIFPGITENGNFILTNLLAAIYHWPESGIPKNFEINCWHKATLILAISNEMALRLGYGRYLIGQEAINEIEVPNDAELDKLKAAVTFSNEEIETLCFSSKISPLAAQDFLLDLESFVLDDDKENPLIHKPLLRREGKLIVIAPTNLSYALTNHLWEYAAKFGCLKEVNNAYHNLVWNNCLAHLQMMRFIPIHIQGITLTNSLDFREAIFVIDEDKLAYVQYLFDNGANYGSNPNDGNFGNLSRQEAHKKEVISKIFALSKYSEFEILDLIIVSPIGRDFMYSPAKISKVQTILIPAFELDVLANLKNCKALDLWKFTICLNDTMKRTDIFSGYLLDKYKTYKDSNDSFYLSDESPFNAISIEVSHSFDLIKEAKLKMDRHSAIKVIEGKFSNLQVERKEGYAPIYVDPSGLMNSELEFLVDGFSQPIWVRPESNLLSLSGEIRSLVWQYNDAIAYWLWQVLDDIKPYLEDLGDKPIEVSFDLYPLEKFKVPDRNYKRVSNLSELFQSEVGIDYIVIRIPSEILAFLYGPDNEGERQVLRTLLSGFDRLLANNGLSSELDQIINQIVDSKAPLGMKKKIFILDTSDNLMLDKKNLRGHRYVQEYDTGVILDSIIPALGKYCPPVGEVKTLREKNELSHNVIQKALLPLLRKKLRLYNSTDLIKILISQNESLIREKEQLKVLIPTRIACFGDIQEHQKDVKETLRNLDNALIANRCLTEHLAAEPSKGSKIISTTSVDELMAIMNQVISWGSLSDQIHYNLIDLKMGILPSGRIGTEKSHIKEIFDPYYESKTQENISDAIEAFNGIFNQDENVDLKEVPQNLDKAFYQDYGITLTRIIQFMDGLVLIGLGQATTYSSASLKDLPKLLEEHIGKFDRNEFDNAMAYLSLTNRGNLESLPDGYEPIDIMPWRYNRMLSLLRKPIVLVDPVRAGDSKIAYWGFRQMLTSKLYLADQFHSNRLRVSANSEVKKVLGKFANDRGKALVKKIFESIRRDELLMDTDVFIGPNYSLKNDIDIGDIDVLVIDKERKILFSLECKSMAPSRNTKEMIEEVEKLFGSKSEMGWVDKHLRRHDWIEANRLQVTSKYGIDISDFIIKSIFITNEEMLTPSLKKGTLPMPFVTSYKIEREGYEILLKY
jgi:hypothetical protein